MKTRDLLTTHTPVHLFGNQKDGYSRSELGCSENETFVFRFLNTSKFRFVFFVLFFRSEDGTRCYLDLSLVRLSSGLGTKVVVQPMIILIFSVLQGRDTDLIYSRRLGVPDPRLGPRKEDIPFSSSHTFTSTPLL